MLHSQKEIESNNEFLLFSIYIKPTFDFRQEILSLGEDAEILLPVTFINEMKSISGKMSEMNNSEKHVWINFTF